MRAEAIVYSFKVALNPRSFFQITQQLVPGYAYCTLFDETNLLNADMKMQLELLHLKPQEEE